MMEMWLEVFFVGWDRRPIERKSAFVSLWDFGKRLILEMVGVFGKFINS